MGKPRKLTALVDGLRKIHDFPPEGYPRRTADGYPSEIVYDEFAYKRMVDSYRDGARLILAEAGFDLPKSEDPR